MKIKIKRRSAPDAPAYYVSCEYFGAENISVADLLSTLNAEAFANDRIAWDCACLEGRCGACAMRINGRPSLACKSLLRDAVRDGQITIEPLTRFPVKKDLAVDRGAMLDCGSAMKQKPGEDGMAFAAAQCLMCGCCIEICPAYSPGGTFPGPAGILRKYLEGTLAHEDTAPCLHCGACTRICPQGIDLGKYTALH